MCLSGRNWGGLEIDGKTVTFKVDGKPVFDIPLPEVTGANQSKDEVLLEFQPDDTTGAEAQDTLMGISFHIPEDNEEFGGEGVDGDVPARRFLDLIMKHTDADVGNSTEAVASFDDIAVSVPRGRFVIQMHMAMMKLLGQSQEYKIKYRYVQSLNNSVAIMGLLLRCLAAYLPLALVKFSLLHACIGKSFLIA